MAGIILEPIEPELRDWLRERAAARGVSVEAEARALLHAAREADAARRRGRDEAAWQALFALAYTPPPGSPSAVEILREDRDGR